MSILYIIVLSIVQGLTEFLPVSSSGHLVIMPHIFGVEDQGLLMDLAVHLGTLCAVVVYYFKDIFIMSKSLILWNNKKLSEQRRLAFYLIVATIPAVVIGFTWKMLFPEGLRDINIVIFNLIFFAVVMILAEKVLSKNLTLDKINLKSALTIGFAQVLAFIPGVSRSGITISTGRFLGFNHVDAAKFSFLLSIPAVAGAGLLGFIAFIKQGNFDMGLYFLIAIGTSFISGIFAISIMMRFLKRIGLIPFAIYRIVLALFLLFFIA